MSITSSYLVALFSFFASFVFAETGPVNPNANATTREVLRYFYSLTARQNKRIVSGQFLDHGTQANLDEVTAVYNKTGHWVGMIGGDYYGRIEPVDITDESWTSDANWAETNPLLIDYWNSGGLVTICLHPFNPQSGKSAWIKVNDDNIDLTDIITPGKPGYDTWMNQLDKIAEGLQELKDEGVVVLFRPFHEMNGNWFWWGSMNTPAEFTNLWKHMFDYFTDTKGLDNLLWYYSPSARSGVMDFYPGDDYVDMVGVDYYGHKDNGPDIPSIRNNGYLELTATEKPFGLGEFGPYHGINMSGSTRNDYDYEVFMDEVVQHLPLCTSFLIWHQNYGLQFQQKARQCLEHPWVVNREDLPSFTVNAQGLKPYSANPSYWELDGKPTILLGGSWQDNPWQWAGSYNSNLLINELDSMVNAGANYIRNTMSQRNVAYSGDPEYYDVGMAYPFGKSGGRYDLDTWNSECWERLDNFLKETWSRRIVVQLEIWDKWSVVGPTPWSFSPWNGDNNVNYSFSDRNSFFNSVPAMNNAAAVMYYQDRYIDKMLSITLNYDNVLYQINNESEFDFRISDYWADFIHQKAALAGRTVYVCDSRRYRPPGYDSTDFQLAHHKENKYPLQNHLKYNFLDISQNGGNTGQTHYDNLIWYRGQAASYKIRPVNHTKTYAMNWPTGLEYSQRTPGTDWSATTKLWRSLFGGAATVRFHRNTLDQSGDFYFGIGLTDLAKKHIESARKMLNIIDIFSMAPSNGLLSGRTDDEAYCLAQNGVQYAVYFTGLGNHSVSVNLVGGEYSYRWLDVENNSYGESGAMGGGQQTISAPDNRQWVIVITANS